VDARDICAKTRFALLPGHDGVDKPARNKSIFYDIASLTSSSAASASNSSDASP
jgi:hypothetical protein